MVFLAIKSERLKFRNIENFGQRYVDDYLYNVSQWNIKKLKDDWWEALKFFFGHSFMRGRSDELSNDYYYFTIASLEKRFTNGKGVSYEKLVQQKKYFDSDAILQFKTERNMGRRNSVKHRDFEVLKNNNPILKILTTKEKIPVEWNGKTTNKSIYLGNETDVLMVLDCLKYVSEGKRKNVYNYLKSEVTSSGVKTVYNELNEIYGIADKIAAFIIRDIMLLTSDQRFSVDDYKMAFPVDTWVRKIALEKLDCNEKSNDEEIKQYLIEKCTEFNLNPLKFAAGVWYLGFNSLDLLLEKLETVVF